MIVVSIGDIISWAIGGIGLIILGIAWIIDSIGTRREKRLEEKLKKTEVKSDDKGTIGEES